MALSFNSVKKAYTVFNTLKKEFGVPENIPSWPEDMQQWKGDERENPKINTVYGWDKKSDDGWENLYFFTENPSEELKKRFDELAEIVPNSTMNKPYSYNEKLWIIGWF